MIGYIIIILISLLIIIGIYKWLSGRALDKIQRYKESEFYLEKERYKKELDRQFEEERENYINELLNIKKEIEDKKEFNSSLQKVREEELGRVMEEKRRSAEERLALEIQEWARSAQEAASFEFHSDEAKLKEILANYELEKYKIENEINEYKEKRDAINQDILRARALEEQQDFYRIQLDETSKKDLAVINSFRSEISKIDLLDKLLYDIYVKKPVDEMVKRVLGGRAPSGIYKITRLKTGEIYIGKSTDVKARWQQHTKSAFHCGTISHSILHTTMERDGVDNFTFELIEEVPKDKLSEREKYWIEFYDSKNYGLNEKAGG